MPVSALPSLLFLFYFIFILLEEGKETRLTVNTMFGFEKLREI
jgi:hypothetical protein